MRESCAAPKVTSVAAAATTRKRNLRLEPMIQANISEQASLRRVLALAEDLSGNDRKCLQIRLLVAAAAALIIIQRPGAFDQHRLRLELSIVHFDPLECGPDGEVHLFAGPSVDLGLVLYQQLDLVV